MPLYQNLEKSLKNSLVKHVVSWLFQVADVPALPQHGGNAAVPCPVLSGGRDLVSAYRGQGGPIFFSLT